MADRQFKEYQKLFSYLNSLFYATGYLLTHKKPKSILKGLITNSFFWVLSIAVLFFGYLVLFEESERYVVVQQSWAIAATLEFIVSVINRQIHWDEIQNLISWFESVFTRGYPEDYQEIFHNMKERINKYYKWIFW